MDDCSRRVIGWSIDASQKTELVIGAIGMAILRRRPAGNSTILHSDHGTQYARIGAAVFGTGHLGGACITNHAFHARAAP